jgi:hypothetical protein
VSVSFLLAVGFEERLNPCRDGLGNDLGSGEQFLSLMDKLHVAEDRGFYFQARVFSVSSLGEHRRHTPQEPSLDRSGSP